VGLLSTLLAKANQSTDALIVCAKSSDNIRPLIRRLLTFPEAREIVSIAIFGDADSNFTRSRDKFWGAFGIDGARRDVGKRNGFLEEGNKRYAVWISPNNKGPGTIENMVLDTFDRKTRKCIADLWQCTGGSGAVQGPSAKAEVAVWIALRNDAGAGLRTAFEKGLIDLDHQAFARLCSLVKAQLAHGAANTP
jgi:hypothetical protein